jgi:hypothetical protein
MPAFRYRIFSTTATGLWSIWNDPGALVEYTGTLDDHDTGDWVLIEGDALFESVIWRKTIRLDEEDGYAWQLQWKRTDDPLTLLDILDRDPEKCNTDITLPDWESGPGFPGSLGTDAQAFQVIFDETMPPD